MPPNIVQESNKFHVGIRQNAIGEKISAYTQKADKYHQATHYPKRRNTSRFVSYQLIVLAHIPHYHCRSQEYGQWQSQRHDFKGKQEQ